MRLLSPDIRRKIAILTDKEKRIVAYHESGMQLVAAKQTNSAPVQKITIVPRTSGLLAIRCRSRKAIII